jgi:hypothetical protein
MEGNVVGFFLEGMCWCSSTTVIFLHIIKISKIDLSKQLQIDLRCLKIRQNNFLSTNKKGKFIERCINIPPLKTPL